MYEKLKSQSGGKSEHQGESFIIDIKDFLFYSQVSNQRVVQATKQSGVPQVGLIVVQSRMLLCLY